MCLHRHTQCRCALPPSNMCAVTYHSVGHDDHNDKLSHQSRLHAIHVRLVQNSDLCHSFSKRTLCPAPYPPHPIHSAARAEKQLFFFPDGYPLQPSTEVGVRFLPSHAACPSPTLCNLNPHKLGADLLGPTLASPP